MRYGRESVCLTRARRMPPGAPQVVNNNEAVKSRLSAGALALAFPLIMRLSFRCCSMSPHVQGMGTLVGPHAAACSHKNAPYCWPVPHSREICAVVCKKEQPKGSEELTKLKSQFTNLGTCFIDLQVPFPMPLLTLPGLRSPSQRRVDLLPVCTASSATEKAAQQHVPRSPAPRCCQLPCYLVLSSGSAGCGLCMLVCSW